ncbi:Class II Aldolase and Adducin N-terminal domain protein [Fusarium sp. Ph1]|nr:Class II Aldolase and Adducin N-terminal domain protein [Fusarium sp. Ph1]
MISTTTVQALTLEGAGTTLVNQKSVAKEEEEHTQVYTTGAYSFPGIPKLDDLYKKRQWQLEHMAAAFRVFARKGFTEGTAGHISVRDPVQPNTFWINPFGVHFAMLKASDMVHIDEDGNVIGGNRVAVNKAGFQIHGAIHKARPDINAACHTHSPAGKAWSTFGRPLDIISQDTCAFLGIQAVYENFGGIVLEGEEGQRIAEALGEKNRVVILQNHGILTTGQTVDEAAYLFTLLERSCEVQIMVESTGLPKKVISKEEAEYTAKIYQEPDALYIEFQPDLNYEVSQSNGQLAVIS